MPAYSCDCPEGPLRPIDGESLDLWDGSCRRCGRDAFFTPQAVLAAYAASAATRRTYTRREV